MLPQLAEPDVLSQEGPTTPWSPLSVTLGQDTPRGHGQRPGLPGYSWDKGMTRLRLPGFSLGITPPQAVDAGSTEPMESSQSAPRHQ